MDKLIYSNEFCNAGENSLRASILENGGAVAEPDKPPLFAFLDTQIIYATTIDDSKKDFRSSSQTDSTEINSSAKKSKWRIFWVTLVDETVYLFKNEIQLEKDKILSCDLSATTKVEAFVEGRKIGFMIVWEHLQVKFLCQDPQVIETWMMTLINRSLGDFRTSENFYFSLSTCGNTHYIYRSFLEQPKVEVLYSFFDKESHIFKNWKRRLMILDETSLRYYPNLAEDNFPSVKSKLLGDINIQEEIPLPEFERGSVVGRVMVKSARTIGNQLLRRNLLHVNTYQINSGTEVAVFPRKYKGRKFAFAVIFKEYHDYEISDGTSNVYTRDDLPDRDIDFYSLRRVSIRISAPDEATMRRWIEAIFMRIDLHKM